MREVDVTAASAHKKFDTITANNISLPKELPRIAAINKLLKDAQPVLAATAMSGTAKIMDKISIKPNTSDQPTACSMPRCTVLRASLVSSEVWAEASKPGIANQG